MNTAYENEELKDTEISEPGELCISREAPHVFFTEIPNIVFELLSRELISRDAFILYTVYKRTTGQTGKCWKGFRKLGKETGLSQGQISNVRKELQKPFALLGGMPLIEIVKSDPKENKADVVYLNNIWHANFFCFNKSLTCSPHERPRSPHEHPRSPGEHKKEHIKKEPKKKESDDAIGLEKYFSSKKVSDEAIELTKDLYSMIKTLNPMVVDPTKSQFNKEAHAMDVMIRIDKRTHEQIKKVIEYLEWNNLHPLGNGSFKWAHNVLSVEKLRKHFARMWVEMMNKPKEEVKKQEENKVMQIVKGNIEISRSIKKKIKEENQHLVNISDNCVQIKNGSTFINLSFTENGFRDQFESILRKLRIL